MKYELDNIYCVDCYEAIKDIPDKSIDLIITDPPYLIENTRAGGHNDFTEGGKKSIQHMNDELAEGRFTESVRGDVLFPELVRVMKAINLYVWCNGKQIPMYLDYFVKEQDCTFDILIWHKTNAMPLFNNKYLTDKEYCLYFRKGGYCAPQSYEDAKTVWDMPINATDKKRFNHCTIKPLSIIETLVRNSTTGGGTILDPFAGSGTTAVAAKNLGRHYIGFEIDEKWAMIARNRLNNTQADGQITFITM